MLKNLRVTLLTLALLAAFALPTQAATYYLDCGNYVLKQGATADADTTIVYDAGVASAQTITVSKNGGAFGATAGTVATQIEGQVYKLVIHETDIDATGNVTFKSVGTDTTYLFNISVVTHDVQDDIAAVLADTGTDGVVVNAASLATDAVNEIVDQVWTETLADHSGTPGRTSAALADIETDATSILDDTGTAGVVLKAAGLDTDAVNEIVDQVWDEALGDHVIGSSFGKAVADTETDADLIVADTGTDGVVLTNVGLATTAVDEIVDQVWDELTSAHANAGSLGRAIADGVDVAATADAVWDEALSGHVAGLSFGKAIADIEADATSIVDDTGTAGVVLYAAGLQADAVNEIAAASAAATESAGVYIYRVHKNERVAENRTLYFRALGTLPANAAIYTRGGGSASSDNSPATVNGNYRKLVLSQAECNFEGRLMIDITTTGVVSYITIIVDLTKQDPFTGRRTGGR